MIPGRIHAYEPRFLVAGILDAVLYVLFHISTATGHEPLVVTGFDNHN